MSKAKIVFESSIKDAENLLMHFDSMPKPPSESSEVLKRAGLVMALTAWETYVEDRVREEVNIRLSAAIDGYAGKFISQRLDEELKRFHNPSSEKTRKLFIDFLETDITIAWQWQNFDAQKVKKTLDELVVKRGDAVHRSKPLVPGTPPAPHLVKREDLDKSIRFLKSLVEVTDKVSFDQ